MTVEVRSKAIKVFQANLKTNSLTQQDLMLAAMACLRSDDEIPGFNGTDEPTQDDCRQLLETGWKPAKTTRLGLCCSCDGVMEIGDEFPEERVCTVCVNVL